MRADVLQVLDRARGIVFFRCESGSASARWMGPGEVREGRFDVEIDVQEEIEEWVNATSRATAISGAAEAGAEVRITGEVLKVSDDAVVEVQVGTAVLLVEIPNGRHDLARGDRISFQVREIQLYPYDL